MLNTWVHLVDLNLSHRRSTALIKSCWWQLIRQLVDGVWTILKYLPLLEESVAEFAVVRILALFACAGYRAAPDRVFRCLRL